MLNPLLFGLVFFIGAFILLYFFRKQFTEKVITSNLLWQEVMKEWEAQPWLDKLQRNILFWLQLFALVFLLFALLRPFWIGEGIKGKNLIFVVDTSATMNAIHNELTILEKNKQRMKEITEQLNHQPVTIITTGNNPTILLKDETEKRELLRVIDELETNYEHEHIEKSLQLARGLSDETTAIHIFTDSLNEETVSELIVDRYVIVHNNEEPLDNISLRSFGVGQTEAGLGGIAIIENQSLIDQVVNFTVTNEEQIFYETQVELKKNSQEMVAIPHLPEANYYLAGVNVEDDYSMDNIFTAVYQDIAPSIYAVGDINPFYIRGLTSIGIEVIQIEQLTPTLIEKDGIILTSDRDVLENPSYPTIYVASSNEDQMSITQTIEQKEVELLQYVNMQNVYIEKASDYYMENLETIVSSGEVPLIQFGIQKGFPVISLLFPLEATDWPLHANFPIFLYNAYHWINSQSNYLGYFLPGEEKWLSFGNIDSLEIFTSSGENLYSLSPSLESFRAPSKPGLYQAVSQDEIYYFSVLLDEREKQVATNTSFELNADIFTEGEEQVIRDNLWFYFTIIVLLILMIEWEVYRRHV